VDDLWATKSEDVGLIVRAISFKDFQLMWSWSTNVTDRKTNGMQSHDRALHYSASRGKNTNHARVTFHRYDVCSTKFSWKVKWHVHYGRSWTIMDDSNTRWVQNNKLNLKSKFRFMQPITYSARAEQNRCTYSEFPAVRR